MWGYIEYPFTNADTQRLIPMELLRLRFFLHKNDFERYICYFIVALTKYSNFNCLFYNALGTFASR